MPRSGFAGNHAGIPWCEAAGRVSSRERRKIGRRGGTLGHGRSLRKHECCPHTDHHDKTQGNRQDGA
jgi:hypothetical protein